MIKSFNPRHNGMVALSVSAFLLCHGRLLQTDQPFYIVDDAGHADFHRGSGDGDGENDDAHH